jgi:leucyl-tRNA synthetase
MPWPKYEVDLLEKEEKLIIVQINGKLRDKLTIPASCNDEELEEKALSLPKIEDKISGKKIMKVIVVSGKLVNIVVE